MKTIHKYVLEELAPDCSQTVRIPKNAIILDVKYQRNLLCVWCEIETKNNFEDIVFHMVGTGWNIPIGDNKLIYIKTIHGLNFIWHIYYNKGL